MNSLDRPARFCCQIYLGLAAPIVKCNVEALILGSSNFSLD